MIQNRKKIITQNNILYNKMSSKNEVQYVLRKFSSKNKKNSVSKKKIANRKKRTVSKKKSNRKSNSASKKKKVDKKSPEYLMRSLFNLARAKAKPVAVAGGAADAGAPPPYQGIKGVQDLPLMNIKPAELSSDEEDCDDEVMEGDDDEVDDGMTVGDMLSSE